MPPSFSYYLRVFRFSPPSCECERHLLRSRVFFLGEAQRRSGGSGWNKKRKRSIIARRMPTVPQQKLYTSQIQGFGRFSYLFLFCCLLLPLYGSWFGVVLLQSRVVVAVSASFMRQKGNGCLVVFFLFWPRSLEPPNCFVANLRIALSNRRRVLDRTSQSPRHTTDTLRGKGFQVLRGGKRKGAVSGYRATHNRTMNERISTTRAVRRSHNHRTSL